jgi:hypothetical protein
MACSGAGCRYPRVWSGVSQMPNGQHTRPKAGAFDPLSVRRVRRLHQTMWIKSDMPLGEVLKALGLAGPTFLSIRTRRPLLLLGAIVRARSSSHSVGTAGPIRGSVMAPHEALATARNLV